jgi:hypothetical protein
MLQVCADSGLRLHRALADGAYELTFPLPSGEADAALGTYRDTVAERERSADLASLRHLLIPASVAVIGASRRPDSVGRVILRNIITGGFRGPAYAVNPGAAYLADPDAELGRAGFHGAHSRAHRLLARNVFSAVRSWAENGSDSS